MQPNRAMTDNDDEGGSEYIAIQASCFTLELKLDNDNDVEPELGSADQIVVCWNMFFCHL